MLRKILKNLEVGITKVISVFMSCSILYAPLMGCQQNTQPQTVVYTTTQNVLSDNSVVSSVGNENGGVSVSGKVEIETVEQSEQYFSKPSASIVSENKMVNLNSEQKKVMLQNLKGLQRRNSDTEETTLNDVNFELENSSQLTEADKLIYDKMIENISNSESFSEEKISEKIDEYLSFDGLESDIEQAVSEITLSQNVVSRSGDVQISEEDLEKLTSTIQEVVNNHTMEMATVTLPIADELSEAGFEVIDETLNSTSENSIVNEELLQAVENTIQKYNASQVQPRYLDDSSMIVDNKEKMGEMLSNNKSELYSKLKTGDILYVHGPGRGDVITGHAALWDASKKMFFTADRESGKEKLKTTHYSINHQITDKTDIQNLKLLHVNSSKTQSEIQTAINKNVKNYDKREYAIKLRKSNDSKGLYCSQVAWLIWDDLGVNIDGSFLASSFTVRNLVPKVLSMTISLGWIRITISIVIFVVVLTLFTCDLVYPWDIVIDGDTREYCRVGKKDPGAW
ncbi:MAG: hypothetical protein IJ361_08695 [Spirochaetaceae bacterium]|nr:hypothetical protein [Spirochaetaceae bacterium]